MTQSPQPSEPSGYAAALDRLVDELEDFVRDRYVSSRSSAPDGGYLSLEPIEESEPELYAAVQQIERYTDGKLPLGGWECWNELLNRSRAAK